MLNFLIKKSIKNYEKIDDINVRNSYGILAAIIGMITNAILVISKITIGLVTNTLSIVANGVDNLSDFGSNIITLVGFKIAKKPADSEHPYGHERVEYIAGLIVSMIIVFIGGSLGIESIQKLINYKSFEISDKLFYITISILIISLFIKIYQSIVYKKLGKRIKSQSLHDTCIDSLFDSITTTLILVGLIINYALLKNNIPCPFSIDGLLGVIESIMIVISGINLVKTEANYLIGKPIDKEYVDSIVEYINSFDAVLGTHDALCHMYGPSKCFMTIHCLVDANKSFIDIDNSMEEIEQAVEDKYHITLTIHMDPYLENDPKFKQYFDQLSKIVCLIDEKLTIHDLRIVHHHKKTILVFDVLKPFECKLDNIDIKNRIIKYYEND
ncbi:MAG: cation diffusion facilitator family transporter, partial [Acholeplasmatales bacterium]|nr:cation diffusion facilitator family transporter [Acholeplasmatales bacterium]